MIRRLLGFLLLPVFVLASCDKDVKPAATQTQSSKPTLKQEVAGQLPITQMQLGGEDFSMEIAGSSYSRELGLMYRDHLDTDHGMIFVFPDIQQQWFWNKNVHFPLDVVFLDESGTVVSIIHMDPYSEKNIGSGAPVKYAIELNAGEAQRLHLDNGTHLKVPPEALNALVPDK